MISKREPARPGVWAGAITGTLLLHIVAFLGIRALDLLAAAPTPDKPEIIDVFFPPREEPTLFTELPEDLATEAPEEPDFLSNIDSQAGDDAPDDDASDLPQLEGLAETPQVRMAVTTPPATPPPVPRAPTATEPSLRQTLLRESLSKRAPSDSDSPPPTPSETGASDIFQEETANPRGNAPAADISLNTTAWDFAPWMQAFRRAVFERWHTPSAYYMGLVHGWTVLELEVAPSGEIVRVTPIEQDVTHRSLHEVAEYALSAAGPYRPLPDHFPEESLVITVKFHYPMWRRRR